MFTTHIKRTLFSCSLLLAGSFLVTAQTNIKLKYDNSALYAGIEVGSKGVKMSLLEIGNNAQKSGAFLIVKDTSFNTDFISFTQASYDATLKSLNGFYNMAVNHYMIPTKSIFTTVSSGVKGQAEKEDKMSWVTQLISSFRATIREPERLVTIVDVATEAKLSHLGIVPDERRYSTFLIDIGSGNSKGGYFPNGNTKDFKLFSLNWGTKSVANNTEKRLEDDKTIGAYTKQLYRVLEGAEHADIIYAINESGSYPLSDNVAFSGGISWSIATLLYPELIENPVVPVTFDEVVKFSEKLASNPHVYSEYVITQKLAEDNAMNTALVSKEVKRVHQVFDQKSLMAGTGLLLKIMRQFESLYEKKQFFLVKNGQVGWISAFVNQNISK